MTIFKTFIINYLTESKSIKLDKLKIESLEKQIVSKIKGFIKQKCNFNSQLLPFQSVVTLPLKKAILIMTP